jgi:hypothetical protein
MRKPLVGAALVCSLAIPASPALATSSGLVMTPRTVNVGNVAVGETETVTLTVVNRSDGVYTVGGWDAGGYNGNFMAVEASSTCPFYTTTQLDPGESCTLTVTVSPSVQGQIRGTACVSGYDSNNVGARPCAVIKGRSTG